MKTTFPQNATRRDCHTFSTKGRTYDVRKLVDYASNSSVPVRELEVESIHYHLNRPIWTDELDMRMQPSALLEAYETWQNWSAVKDRYPHWEAHVERVEKADYMKPIIMLSDGSGDTIIDGYHRLIAAIADGISVIQAYELSVLPTAALVEDVPCCAA